MARYIDADLLIKNIASIEDLRTLSTKTIGEAIDKTPTADVVGVVRCKDCKHANDDGTICRYSVGRAVEPEHFCSYGERKSDFKE